MRRLDEIQVLRAIAVIFVFFEHIAAINHGAFGVDIFFVISGFVIVYSTVSDAKHFLLKRVLKIVPLYWGTTLCIFVFVTIFPSLFRSTIVSVDFLFKSLIFIPFEIEPGIVQPILRIGWTLNYELFFYIIFFLAMKISYQYRGLIACSALILLVFLGNLLHFNSVVLRFYTNPILLEFVYGMICY